MAIQRVRAYINAFNLYHGTQDRYGLILHWIDPQALARCLLRQGQRLERVSYFTARVREQHPGRHQQDTHLQAIAAHCPLVTIVEGRFQEKTVACRKCTARWCTYEEKETDVSLAVSLVEDTARDLFDVALVVSADSDMSPAIRAVHRLRPGKKVIVVFPPRRHSDELVRNANRVLRIDRTMLNRSQLPARWSPRPAPSSPARNVGANHHLWLISRAASADRGELAYPPVRRASALIRW